MTMTIDTPSISAEPASQSPRLRIGLIVLSSLILLSALAWFPAIFFDYEHTDRLAIFAQRLTSLKLALSPVIAATALYFAIRTRLTSAIVALATLMLVNWLSELPSIAFHGFDLRAVPTIVLNVGTYILYPLMAVAAISLALRNERLVTAAVLTAIPSVMSSLGVVMFAVGVAIYGF